MMALWREKGNVFLTRLLMLQIFDLSPAEITFKIYLATYFTFSDILSVRTSMEAL